MIPSPGISLGMPGIFFLIFTQNLVKDVEICYNVPIFNNLEVSI